MSASNRKNPPAASAESSHSRPGSRIVCTTSATTSAGTTIRFGTMRRSMSVTVMATTTAQPRALTTASTDRPKTARHAIASPTQVRAAASRRRTQQDSPQIGRILSPGRGRGIPSCGWSSRRASPRRSVDCGAAPAPGVRAHQRHAQSHYLARGPPLVDLADGGRARRRPRGPAGGAARRGGPTARRCDGRRRVRLPRRHRREPPRLTAGDRAAARPPRRAHRPAEPRAARRPDRAGARALAADGRGVRAARRRHRRVQGRQRRARP